MKVKRKTFLSPVFRLATQLNCGKKETKGKKICVYFCVQHNPLCPQE